MSEAKINTIIPLSEARVINYLPDQDSAPREMRVVGGWAAIIDHDGSIESATIYYDQHGLYRGFVNMSSGPFEFVWSPHSDIAPDEGERDVLWDLSDEFKFLFLEYLNYKQTK